MAPAVAQQGQQGAIIVKLVEPPTDPTGLSDVLVTALGLTGALTVLAVSFGLLVGGILFFVRRRRPLPGSR